MPWMTFTQRTTSMTRLCVQPLIMAPTLSKLFESGWKQTDSTWGSKAVWLSRNRRQWRTARGRKQWTPWVCWSRSLVGRIWWPGIYQLAKHHHCACCLLNLVSTVDVSEANTSIIYKRLSRSGFSKCWNLWNKSRRFTTADLKGDSGRCLLIQSW